MPIWTAPRTWVVGEEPTAAILNQQIRDNMTLLGNPPRATAFATAAQNHPTTATWATVSLDSESVDTDSMHSTVTNNSRLTCVTAGKYEVSGQITFAANATGRRAGRLIVNNTGGGNLGQTEEAAATAAGGSTTTIVIPAIEITMAVSDFVEMQGFQSSGGALAFGVGTLLTFLRAKWIGV